MDKRDRFDAVGAESLAKLLRIAHTGVDMAAPVDLDAVARDIGLSTEEREVFERRLSETRKWLEADESRAKRFRDAPIQVLGERFEGLKERIPKGLLEIAGGGVASPCSSGPPSGLYNDCAMELLRRVGVWAAQGPGNRTTFVTDPDAAVDAVAGSAPMEAVVLVKGALRAVRQYP